MIARRAEAALREPSPLVTAHFRCAQDRWCPDTNPGGCINLGTAENYLAWDLVGARLATTPPLPEALSHYQELHGMATLRRRLARHLQALMGAPIAAEDLVVVGGAAAALEILAFALCDPGEGVIVPAPYYSGFDGDFGARGEVRLVPAPGDPEAGFAVRREALEAAFARATADGIRVRAVLVTSPENPLGRTMPAEAVDAVLAFAEAHGLEAIFDEIYAGSVYGDRPFVSALARAGAYRPHVHVVYGFAKDFGVSGFKAGALLPGNPHLREVAREFAQLSPLSTMTQHALAHLLDDEAWLAAFLAENQRRLRETRAHVVAALAGAGVPALPGDAAIFAWLDLRGRLAAPTFEAEAALARRIFDEARVNLTPGGAFHAPEPGWFRICFARPRPMLDVALGRLLPLLARP